MLIVTTTASRSRSIKFACHSSEASEQSPEHNKHLTSQGTRVKRIIQNSETL